MGIAFRLNAAYGTKVLISNKFKEFQYLYGQSPHGFPIPTGVATGRLPRRCLWITLIWVRMGVAMRNIRVDLLLYWSFAIRVRGSALRNKLRAEPRTPNAKS